MPDARVQKVFFAIQCFLLSNVLIIGAGGCNLEQNSINKLTFKAKRNSFIEKYPKIPHDELLHQITGSRIYNDLLTDYSNNLINLKNETDADFAKLIVVVLSTRVGKFGAPENIYGIPQIVQICDNVNVECVNLVPKLMEGELTDIARIPEETIWSRHGADVVAGLLGDVIAPYKDHNSSRDLANLKKPETFGDLEPDQDEIKDAGKSLPYKFHTNSQGLRMDHNITFPKKKQTILFLGDNRILSPYLDDSVTPLAILQRRFPDKEIINAGVDHYCMEDFASLYHDKGRYTEPDIVVVCTDGSDVLDGYFSQRNKYSRSSKIYPPTKIEEEFYFNLYGKK